ncbi:TRIHELIX TRANSCRIPTION FACTOR GTL2 [Salix purpurea]|uniref:TRIHELIX TRANSCRIPTION FACTOR GTL2 n=1 Tax=Salix purpurea TaxID=77065 RepID=A0A9Q0Q1H3_SALPP|nr:TRIHELIX TRANSCRIPTION FACTOR GTL2 [Salix purpurea]
MQPGYGLSNTDHHRQQQHRQQHLMEDDFSCSPSVLPIPNFQNLNYPYQPHLHHHQQQHKHPHQVLLQQHHQLFQLQQQRQSQVQVAPQNPSLFSVNFKWGRNYEGSGNKKAGALNNQEEAACTTTNTATFHDGNVHFNPPHAIFMPHSWHPQEDSTTIKEPFWKQLNKQRNGSEEQEVNESKSSYFRPLEMDQVVDESSEGCKILESKCPLFNELEAIYSLAQIAEANQTGSGSVLTCDNSPTNAGLSMPFSVSNGQNVGAYGAANNVTGVDRGSENSIGEEASLRRCRKRKRKGKLKEKLNYMAGFFENSVKKVMNHQEILHRKFLEVIERMDKERAEREATWRCQEAEKYSREAISIAHERASASRREAQIVSYIEKITGQSIDLLSRMAPPLLQPEISNEPVKEITPTKTDSHSRWPKYEVEALIQVRSRIEIKFQEPGLKGPLWEEVSSLMSSMGYQRSAKRCKEKWENINKYFRKARESPKRGSARSKTCSYFNQLDQLYSGTLINYPPNTTYMPSSDIELGIKKQGYTELCEAFSVRRDHLANVTTPVGVSVKSSEMGSSRFEFDGLSDQNTELEEDSSEQDIGVYKDDKQKDDEQLNDGGDEEIENRG